LISKEINKAEHEYMNMCPPIIVQATALVDKEAHVVYRDKNKTKQTLLNFMTNYEI
jgi:hypothetical protein